MVYVVLLIIQQMHVPHSRKQNKLLMFLPCNLDNHSDLNNTLTLYKRRNISAKLYLLICLQIPLMSAQILQELCIFWNLFNGIQEGNIDFHPPKSLKKIIIKLHFLCRNGSRKKGKGICFCAEPVLALSSILPPASFGFGSSLPLLKVIGSHSPLD